MPRVLKPAEAQARIEALQSCIDHLELEWTDDPQERRQGLILQGQFLSQINRLLADMDFYEITAPTAGERP